METLLPQQGGALRHGPAPPHRHHHTVSHYIDCARACRSALPGQALGVWGHDHDGAYRQLPIADPNVAFFCLPTAAGPTLWRHNCLLFGSAASVWAYNRFGDALATISRTLLLDTTMHYVDDYGGVEPTGGPGTQTTRR